MTRSPPKIMGILNVTLNSFSDGGRYFQATDAIKHGIKLAEEGADFIDIGGCSTKPFSTPPSIEEEVRRILPVVEALKKEISTPISIDTYRPEVAKAALDSGATFINDISGFRDPRMRKLAKDYQIPVCIMHMQNNPETMQIKPEYPGGVVEEIMHWLNEQAGLCIEEGIAKENIYLDPGICFGKSLDDNFTILHNLDKFRRPGFPLLVGLSRKSFLYKTLGISTEEALNATVAVNSYIYPHVDIFRVHDVKEHKEMLSLLSKIEEKRQPSKEIDRNSTYLHSDH